MAEKDKGEAAVMGFPSPQRYGKGQVTLIASAPVRREGHDSDVYLSCSLIYSGTERRPGM